MVINLSHQKPFAVGGHRQCFIHPEDSNKCIKVLRSERKGEIIRKQHKFPRNLRHAKHYDDNARESHGYRYISSLRKKEIWSHVPHYYGTVETDIGAGGVTELMRDFDGNISQTLRQRIGQCAQKYGELDPICRHSIREFIEFLNSTLFLSRHLTPQNILSVRVEENQERLYMIEGFGAPEWIPLVRYCSFLAKAKMKRKIMRFRERIVTEINIATDNPGL